MKGMNGAELARRLTRQRPDLRVLLMRHPIDRPALEGAEPANTVEKPGGALIEDPFTPAELCDRVADVLASTGSGSEKVVHAIA
jgi:CheY-like chemotaxis protein